jgi:hypothetical protein
LHVRHGASYGNMKVRVEPRNAAQEKGEAVSSGAGRERTGTGAHGRASDGKDSPAQEQEEGKAQTDTGQAARGR